MFITKNYFKKKLFVLVAILFLSSCGGSGKKDPPPPNDSNSLLLSASVTQALGFLQGIQKADGSFADPDDDRLKVWQSAEVMYLLGGIDGISLSILSKGKNFLKDAQRSDGSFYRDVSFDEDNICMETTPVALLALKNNQASKSKLDKGINFLLNKQEAGGEWLIGDSTIPEDHDFPSVTGFVLNTLIQLGVKHNEQINAGIDYLIESQLSDGSWGVSWYYYDTPYYAVSINMMALKVYGLQNTDAFLNALNFVRQNQNEGGYWNRTGEEMSDEFETALALKALSLSEDMNDKQRIKKAKKWLESRQEHDGSWFGGFFPYSDKDEKITTTTIAVEALIRSDNPDFQL